MSPAHVSSPLPAAARFFSLSLLSFGINFGLTVFLHEILGVGEESAFACGIVTVFILNFLGMRFLVFRRSAGNWVHQFLGSILFALTFRGAEYGLFLVFHTWLGGEYRVVIFAILVVSSATKFLFYRYLFETAFANRSVTPRTPQNQPPRLYGEADWIGVTLSNWRVRAVVPYVRGPVFVDLACGDNRLVRTLGFGTGVDIKNHGNADIVHPDFTHLPFADGSVNTVTILAAINYFDNPEAALRDIRRILSHDGVLILTQLSKTLSGFWHVFRDRSLPRIAFSSRELKALIDATGLEVRAKRRFMLGVNTLYIIGRKHD